MSRKQMNVISLGKMDYQEALEWQTKFHALRVRDEIPDTLLLVENHLRSRSEIGRAHV